MSGLPEKLDEKWSDDGYLATKVPLTRAEEKVNEIIDYLAQKEAVQ